MKKTDIKNIKIAKKYSSALFLQAKEDNSEDKIYNDLIFVSETLDTNKHLFDFLINPIIKPQDKKDVIKRLFAPHLVKITIDFLFILTESGRFDVISEILNQYSIQYDKERNIIKPIVTSAIELNISQKERLISILGEKLNKIPQIEFVVNPEIIGGLIVEIDDKTIDCSIKNKFDNMKKQLVKGN